MRTATVITSSNAERTNAITRALVPGPRSERSRARLAARRKAQPDAPRIGLKQN